MRGDIRNLQNDSSSGSSSPHSNTSHEEPVLDDGAENMLHQKVVYNFSIPEFINHEPRIDRNTLDIRRKRNRFQRAPPGHHQQQDEESQSIKEEIADESPVIVQDTKRRRRAVAAAAVAVADLVEEEAAARDDDCHSRIRHNHVPVIDLTGVDSHDEFRNTNSETERIHNRT